MQEQRLQKRISSDSCGSLIDSSHPSAPKLQKAGFKLVASVQRGMSELMAKAQGTAPKFLRKFDHGLFRIFALIPQSCVSS